MGELPPDKTRLEPKSCRQIRESKSHVGWFSVDFQGTNSNSPVKVSAYGDKNGWCILSSSPSNRSDFVFLSIHHRVSKLSPPAIPCWGPLICDSWGRSIAPWRTTSVRPLGGGAWHGGSRRARSSAGLGHARKLWGVSINGGTPIAGWVDSMENPTVKWMMTGGTTISGNLPIRTRWRYNGITQKAYIRN